LGGKVRDRIRVYGHAGTPEHALSLKERGFTAVKVTSVANPVRQTEAVRKAVGDDMDIMVDVAGPPRYTTKDAILVGKALEEFTPLFYEDPVAPENVEGLRQVRDQVDIPIAAGERLSTIWGLRGIIEDELVSVVQPDTGRAGGLAQLKKIAAMAEAHFISIAPHSGSLGPVAEFAALHMLASTPNALILERVEDDVPVRYQVIHPLPTVIDGYISVPDGPGLGVDIDEDVVRAHPSQGNVSVVEDREAAYEPGTWSEHIYFQQRWRRQKMLKRR
jgi:galactonate dehydratase